MGRVVSWAGHFNNYNSAYRKMDTWLYDTESSSENSDLDNPDDEYLPKATKRISSTNHKETEIVSETDLVRDDHNDVGSQTPISKRTRAGARYAVRYTNETSKDDAVIEVAGTSSQLSKRPKTGTKRSVQNDDTATNDNVSSKTPKRPRAGMKGKGKSKKNALKHDVVGDDVEVAGKEKMLNKQQRKKVTDSIRSMPLNMFVQHVEGKLKELSEPILREILNGLLQNKQLLTSLVEYHRTTFTNLYVKHSTGKEKYLHFQLDWHTYCSVFLLPKELSIDHIFPSSPDNVSEINDVRHSWLSFCDAYSSEQGNCNKVMILLSSALYNMLLQQVHTCTQVSTIVSTASYDSHDVYVRFGGATLASMLRLRYRNIRTCHEEKRDIISKEITILQTINTKNKANMPQYLQYRDNGYMYTPDATFVPFFRAIDECIKEVVNQSGLQEHGDDLVKVKLY